MTTAIAIRWWIFLILALLVTLVDVALLRRVVNLSRQIRTLTAATLPAAAGIVGNTAAGEALGRTGQLAANPQFAFHIPLMGRIGIGTLAALWMVTGMLCVPSFMERISPLPAHGLFALFHMLTQHVFLSFSVGVFVLIPRAVYARFGLECPDLPQPIPQDTPLRVAKGVV